MALGVVCCGEGRCLDTQVFPDDGEGKFLVMYWC